jgi:hypothetical protein
MTGTGLHEAREHSHRGCFPGTVWSEKAQNLASLYGKRNIVDRSQRSVPLG